MYNIDVLTLGERIKEYRKLKKVSLEELGEIIGKSKATITRYENGQIIMDIITALEICNALDININDICDINVQNIKNEKTENPFNSNLLYLYYISKNGIIISSIEIEENQYSNKVIMKNGITEKKYKQEYSGIMESSYNTCFICLTNAISNPGLDKFQIEIDLHSKVNNMYFGIFLGVSDNTHRPTARKCILTKELIKSKEILNDIFEELKISKEEAEDIINTKYWDLKSHNIKDYVIKV